MPVTVLNAAKGVYRHNATGFIVHEVFSMADVFQCGGALACDADGNWAWAAGRDLMHEARRYGAGSLLALAQKLLRTYRPSENVIELSQGMDSNWSSWNTAGLAVPGMRFDVRAVNGPRIFGICTNVLAGRGISPGLISGLNVDPGVKWVMALGRWASGTAPEVPYGPGANQLGGTLVVGDATFLGRAHITLPLKSWELLIDNWAKAVPENSRSEVQEKIAIAKATLTPEKLKHAFGVVPVVVVPVVLYSDGTCAIETNSAPTIFSPGDFPRATACRWNPSGIASMPEMSSGWWHTNPFGAGPTGKSCPKGWNSPGGSFEGKYALSDYATPVVSVVPHQILKSIDGVEPFKILGGLFPRLAETGTAFTSSTLINSAYQMTMIEGAVSGQQANEATSAYVSRVEGTYSSTAITAIEFLPNMWGFAGQPAVIATWMLNGFLCDGASHIHRAAAMLMMTGHYNPDGRQMSGTISRAVATSFMTIDQLMSFVEV